MSATTTPDDDPVPDVDPLSGVNLDFPTLWIVCLVAIFVFGFAALWLYGLRRNVYDDRMAWNYGVGMIASGLIAGAAVIVLLSGIFNALSGIVGLLLIAAVLIVLGQR